MVFSRKPTDTQITHYFDFNVSSEKGVEYGLFFRNPLSKKSLVFNFSECKTDAFHYIVKSANPFFRLYQYLLGNRQVVLNVDRMHIDETYFAIINILRSPIHFKRKYRRTEAINKNKNGNISSIISYGISSEECEATCVKEKTITTFSNGIKERYILRDRAHYFTHLCNLSKIINTDKGRLY